MEIKDIQKIINDDSDRREHIIKAKDYYNNKTDIQKSGVVPIDKDPLRNADNRISHNFHQLLVDEKASYMFTYPVLFNVDNNKEINKKITEVLGDDFESISQDLCIEASNAGVAWLHYWINDEKKSFNYALVPTEQIIPIFKKTLKKELKELYRYYYSKSEDNKGIVIVEYWNEEYFYKYIFESNGSTIGKLINLEKVTHKLDIVPFIPFLNNKNSKSDLSKYKNLIDLYDRVMSGFANDLEDIQQII
ncbi:MAG: phage portal protein, partial [Clostridium perfringens]